MIPRPPGDQRVGRSPDLRKRSDRKGDPTRDGTHGGDPRCDPSSLALSCICDVLHECSLLQMLEKDQRTLE